jgi:alpha-tubulin suppressor-like RCC1 family protein
VALLSGWSCELTPPSRLYLGAPGTEATHVVVQVQPGAVSSEVWRLRSRVTVGGRTDESLLPSSPPRSAISLPSTYAVVANGREGTLGVAVDALDRDGKVVGRAAGEVELVPSQGTRLELVLALPCATAADCQDGVFCNGVEVCRDQRCAAGGAACPPSLFACVAVSCDEEARACRVLADDGTCPPEDDGQGHALSRYCDPGMGCVVGRPEAPALEGLATVTPGRARAGDTVRLAFRVNEPLAEAPRVLLDVGTRHVALAAVPAECRPWEGVYVFHHLVDGTEEQGRRDLTVDLLDRAGLTATGLAAGSVVLDFTPPGLASPPLLSAQVLLAGVVATLRLELDEEVALAPAARLVPVTGGAALAWALAGNDLNRTFTYTLTLAGTEAEGAYDLVVEVADLAGNGAVTGPVARVVLDFTAPGILLEPPLVVTPAVAPVGRTVTVEVHVSEPVRPGAVLRGVDGPLELAFRPGDGTDRVLTFLHTVTLGEDGVYALHLDNLVDLGGNRRATTDLGAVVTVDGTAPRLGNLRTGAPRYSRVAGFNHLTAAFDADEDLATPGAWVQVLLAGTALACGAGDGAGRAWACEHQVTESDAEGLQPLLVVASDGAGNVGFATTTVELDFTGPSVRAGSTTLELVPGASNPVARPSRITTGTTLRVSAVSTEPMLPASPPTLVTTTPQAHPFTLVAAQGLDLAWELLLPGPAVEQGAHVAVLTLVDVVGNGSTFTLLLPSPGIVVDTRAPVLVARSTIPAATPQASASFAFDSDEEDRFLCSTDGAAETPCGSPAALSWLAEGTHTFTAWGVDDAGNRSLPVTWSWRVDWTPPAVMVVGGPPASTPERRASFELRCSEPSCTFLCSLDGAAGQPCPALPAYEDLGAGAHTFTARAVDQAGNVGAPSPAVAWNVESGWSQVDAADTHTCAVNTAGALWCWGENPNKEVGGECDDPCPEPYLVALDRAFMKVAAGTDHNCAVATTGSLWCWGDNSWGACGAPSDSWTYPSPVQVGRQVDWVDVDAGENWSCGIQQGGRLSCWGMDPVNIVLTGPELRAVEGESPWTSVSVGAEHACAIQANGSLWCWGSNDDGQLGDGDGGPQEEPVEVDPGHVWRQVSAGDSHTCGIQADRSLWCWGYGGSGALGSGAADNATEPQRVGEGSDWVRVSAGTEFACATRTDGTLWCWGRCAGDPACMEPAPKDQTPTWAVLATGKGHACGVKEDGTLWCWGANTSGALGFTSRDSSEDAVRVGVRDTWVLVQAAGTWTCAQDADDELWCWALGTPGTGATPSSGVPTRVDQAGPWRTWSTGEGHGCAIKTNDTLWCWGANDRGQVGDGTWVYASSPVRVGDGVDWQAVSCGGEHTCALDADNALWCWGANTSGQLGDLSDEDQPEPVLVDDGSVWLEVSAGGSHTCGFQDDGAAWCWGFNGFGQLGTGDTDNLSLPLPVDTSAEWLTLGAGRYHTCGLTTLGQLHCWGLNTAGQLGTGSLENKLTPTRVGALSTWASLTVGASSNCAFLDDDTLWCWG